MPAVVDNLLLETGDGFLLESGDLLLLEIVPDPTPFSVSYVLVAETSHALSASRTYAL